ncbi:S8 family serine peptidase [Bradyrhizobium liaoningense]
MAKRSTRGPVKKRTPRRSTQRRGSAIRASQIRDGDPPRLSEDTWRNLIFRTFGHQRFTQDSPILPDVWLAYAKADKAVRIDIILTPKTGHAPGAIAQSLEQRLLHYHRRSGRSTSTLQSDTMIAYSRSSVVARLTFAELMRVVIPMTSWWRDLPAQLRSFDEVEERLLDLETQRTKFKTVVNTSQQWDYFRFIVLAGFIDNWRERSDPEDLAEVLQTDTNNFRDIRSITEGFLSQFRQFKQIPGDEDGRLIWSISLNRRTTVSLFQSRQAVKADAVHNLFKINTKGIAWAVIDCGIDATHVAFLDRTNKPPPAGQGIPPQHSRIKKTYDFTFLRGLLALQSGSFKTAGGQQVVVTKQQQQELLDLRRRVSLGREIDWDMLLPLITVPYDNYKQPSQEHGTHVAGILAGNWPEQDNDDNGPLLGICPELTLYDFRVFDQNGEAEEFVIMAALQVVAHLNRFRANPVIHGVNLSISIRHEVMSYACGRTPICDECSRLVGDGVVVVAAAGNQGFNQHPETGGGDFGSYRVASITDPGNADAVITVGSTHRNEPYTYGVSYFSSRGPTGDGRRKPDLVAPGEKITAPIPNLGSKRMDGTSMAAPHVSGAAALLMARHRELIGRPAMIKQILCKTATDLGREASFQGAGMLDVLRALQSV